MELVPRIDSNAIGTAIAPVPPATAPPVAPPHEAGGEPAAYDGSPPLTAWAWSWAQAGGSLTDLADALATAHELRASAPLTPTAHGRVDGQRTLALLA